MSFIEDYCRSTKEALDLFSSLKDKRVLIIGMGAVGTWVIDGLARFGVGHFTIVDDDIVELTNIHRQNFFTEDDIGSYKVDVVENAISKYSNARINTIKKKLDDGFFNQYTNDFDLVINCADFPSVDYVTNVIGYECMKRAIPHIIGGGYNLHLSLIGQTVIPFSTACVKCFESHLTEINKVELNGVKKLKRSNRKIGSFGPLCSIAASMTIVDAMKILIRKFEFINNENKRIEYITEKRDFKIFEVTRKDNCEWCGEKGIFSDGL
ncbi:ThiF family adenylyltransferase [Pokkaliibacter sp. MBI-7]|uniref:HesA/MoeB/ThiF family protein n=1 Tax=Pokkaliibacter sp. MBI-7 TaxID=3040600 RepID=UPI00244AF55B|nr:ThiF family adenylyltransferase [Pokkaliibacter sp. MBI-7]MDH2433465.1 ThiF family adenylyltransferase [Pokkaliibacter sp. MBI-7]